MSDIGTYDKIDTLWDRDKETFTVIPGAWRRPEFALLDNWLVSEKIDGTNIRLIFETTDPFQYEQTFEARGKTDRADLPKPLAKVLNGMFDPETEIGLERMRLICEMMQAHKLTSYVLYGEGYGPGIQSGGYYRDDPNFILFDIKANGVWLNEGVVAAAAELLQLDRVPQLENPYARNAAWDPNPLLWTTEDIVRYVRDGDCRTTFAKEEKEAEGVIAKSPVPLYNNRGERLMWKLKGSDFRAGKR